MREADIQVFLNAAIHHFDETAGLSMDVKAPFLVTDIESQLSDLTACIRITGGYTGNVLFTVPKSMLTELLAQFGREDVPSVDALDLVGEMANLITSNAREAFGSGFQLSPPRVTRGKRVRMRGSEGLSAYCIPMQWKTYQSKLIIAVH